VGRAHPTQLTKGLKVEPHSKIQGGLIAKLPDGGAIGFRPASSKASNYVPTIDVHNVPGLPKKLKIKFIR
jgi:hypothetical protein